MKAEIITEYKGTLNMLIDTVNKCPDDLWENDTHENTYWRIVYHTLFYTAFYLSARPDEFVPWDKHLPGYHTLGTQTRNGPIIITSTYSKAELLAYADDILNSVDKALIDSNLTYSTGFDWIALNRFGLHLYNIRHVQHHTGQLTERLHSVGIRGVNWLQ